MTLGTHICVSLTTFLRSFFKRIRTEKCSDMTVIDKIIYLGPFNTTGNSPQIKIKNNIYVLPNRRNCSFLSQNNLNDCICKKHFNPRTLFLLYNVIHYISRQLYLPQIPTPHRPAPAQCNTAALFLCKQFGLLGCFAGKYET